MAVMGMTPAAMTADVPAPVQAPVAVPATVVASAMPAAMTMTALDLDRGRIRGHVRGQRHRRCGGTCSGEGKCRCGNPDNSTCFHGLNPLNSIDGSHQRRIGCLVPLGALARTFAGFGYDQAS